LGSRRSTTELCPQLDAHPEHERAHQRHKDRNIGKKALLPDLR
jgi:hypothetical protein